MYNKLKKILLDKIKEYKVYILPSIILMIIIILTIKYFYQYSYMFKSPEGIKEIILKYEDHAKLTFILIQILQVVVFIIPGEVVQIAGGYVFGSLIGTLLSITGIAIGSSIAFFVSIKLGKPFVKRIISAEKIEFYENKLKTSNFNLMIFVLYLIPGIPKDALGYICGITNIKYKDFITYSTIGRIPAIVVSSYFGNNIYSGDKGTLITIAVVISLVFLIALFSKNKIIKAIEKRNKKS